jgi:hypothetical protein
VQPSEVVILSHTNQLLESIDWRSKPHLLMFAANVMTPNLHALRSLEENLTFFGLFAAHRVAFR